MTKSPRWASAARGLAALLLLGGTGLGVAACGSTDQASSTSAGASTSAVATVGAEEFATAAAKPGTMIIDVRTPAEFAAGHLAGAVNIDVQGSSFADAVAELDPSASYAVYCHSGNRSSVATSYMAGHGFKNLVELAGGITAWEADGKPVTTS
ncbi:MAG TPA: rhodanese-like domain-containing protein [Marmoricola sp.]|nr:rhodanese-like domain-containing protein [Marmoricola sp.]